MDLNKRLEQGNPKPDEKFSPLLLGDGRNAEEIRILKQIGFEEEVSFQEDLLGQQVELQKVKQSFETEKVYSLNNILKICDEYHMIFQPVKGNRNKKIDTKTIVAEILKFNEKNKLSNENVQQDFYVLTTSNLFSGKIKPFMLFYRATDDNTYVLIYSSNSVLKERRKILGKIFDSGSSAFLTTFCVLFSIISFLIIYYSIDLGVQIITHPIIAIILFILYIFGIFLLNTGVYFAIFELFFMDQLLNPSTVDHENPEKFLMLRNIKMCTRHVAGSSYSRNDEKYYIHYYNQYIKFRKNEKITNKTTINYTV